MTNNFDPSKFEAKWQKLWESAELSKAEDFSKKEKYYVLIEFPYPSGAGLHVGHVRSWSAMDAYCRKKRMEGKNVLYPIGWDAFGLPAENYALKMHVHPSAVVPKNIAMFKKQCKSLGLSFDWSREIDTTDPKYYKWTQWIFLKFLEKGMAYQDDVPVNWCPFCKTNLADEEVMSDGSHERCGTQTEKRLQKQWLLKITKYADRLLEDLKKVDYPSRIADQQINWIGRKEGINITYDVEGIAEKITCFTTRPDTNFGATFIVLGPEHELVAKLLNSKLQIQNSKLNEIKKYVEAVKGKKEYERIAESRVKTGVFTGSYAINHLTGTKMPVWISDFVLGNVGTGAVVGVPGHDVRDFEFAQKFKLPIVRVVVGKDGDTSEIMKREQVQEEEGRMINSGFLDGLDIHAATKKVMDYLEKKGWGKRVKVYHMRDWVFSRQHYWGEPIPVVYCSNCFSEPKVRDSRGPVSSFPPASARSRDKSDKNDKSVSLRAAGNPSTAATPRVAESEGQSYREIDGRKYAIVPVPEKDLPVELPYLEKYEPSGTGESPLALATDWVNTKCPQCGGPARRETDTMPNWAGSNWYFLRYLDPHNDKELADKKKMDYWMPVDIYQGGFEHTTLHLLYSRFVYKFLFDIGVVPTDEPYVKRRSHGIVLGSDGRKMSKSFGNVINPEDIVERFGADTLRVYEMFMGPFDQTIAWNEEGVSGCFRFLKRVWVLCHNKVSGKKTSAELLSKLHKTIKKVSEDMESMKFNTAVASMMEFINDWHSDTEDINREDLKKFLLILSPFAPHITEEIWSRTTLTSLRGLRPRSRGARVRDKQVWSIHQQSWPKFEQSLVESAEITLVVQVNGKVRDRIKVGVGLDGAEAKKLALTSSKVTKHIGDREVKKLIYIKDKIINLVI